jgi:hypothetical protein
VTWLAQFFSNDPVTATVTDGGLVTARRHGETSVRAHFQNLVAAVTVTAPFEHDVDPSRYEQKRNVVDEHVFAKLKKLRIPPSPDADDATFVRRAFLDAIGTLPTPREVEGFLADARPDKRDRLVDDLLDRPEWADYWACRSATCCRTAGSGTTTSAGSKGCGRCTAGSAASWRGTARGTSWPARC